MAYEPQEGWGTLFANDRKQQPKHPDWTGDALFEGRTVKLAIWNKQGRRGEFLSIAIQDKAKDEQARAARKRTGFEAPATNAGPGKTNEQPGSTPDLPTDKPDDDVPF
jgi:hypothetical protein